MACGPTRNIAKKAVLSVTALALGLLSPQLVRADNEVALQALLANISTCNDDGTLRVDSSTVGYGNELLIGAYALAAGRSAYVDIDVDNVAINSNDGAVLAQVTFPRGRTDALGLSKGRYLVVAAITPFLVMWNADAYYPEHLAIPGEMLLTPAAMDGPINDVPPLVGNLVASKTIIVIDSNGNGLPLGRPITFSSPVPGGPSFVTTLASFSETNASATRIHCVNLNYVSAYVEYYRNGNFEYFDGRINLTCNEPVIQLGSGGGGQEPC